MTSANGDLVVQNTATTGTGTVTLGAAVTPYLTASEAGFRDGDVVDYSITDTSGSNTEAGWGVLGSTQTTLTRNPDFSTNSNALINLSGTAVVRITPIKRSLDPLNVLVHDLFGGR